MSKYKKYLTLEGILDFYLDLAVVLLTITVALGIVVWILSKIWLWLLGGVLVALGVWIAVQVVRWRRSRW